MPQTGSAAARRLSSSFLWRPKLRLVPYGFICLHLKSGTPGANIFYSLIGCVPQLFYIAPAAVYTPVGYKYGFKSADKPALRLRFGSRQKRAAVGLGHVFAKGKEFSLCVAAQGNIRAARHTEKAFGLAR